MCVSSFDNTLPSTKGTYMIILFSTKSKYNFNYFKKYYDSMVNLPYIECPNCKSTNIIKWGVYKRKINYLTKNTLEFNIINIKRVKCKECGKTHALIPCYIVPYKLNTIDIILNSLINNEVNVSYDTLYKWNKEFNKFLPYLKTIFSNISKKDIIKQIMSDILYYLKEYFRIHNKLLMMIKPGIYNMSYFYISSPT